MMLKAFEMLKEMRSVVMSTAENGIPHSRIIDILNCDEDGIYFLSDKPKQFYKQIVESGKISITSMNKDYVQVRVDGNVKRMPDEILEQLFENDSSLLELFPEKNKYHNFSLFKIYNGKGEIFDLSGRERKLKRERFAFGEETVNPSGCKITDKCVSCGACKAVCPFDAISEGSPYTIDPRYCDECGVCHGVCPVDAIEFPLGL
jgi:uncharacterized pyridoxamine 5'-phosphate oxidase family protein